MIIRYVTRIASRDTGGEIERTRSLLVPSTNTVSRLPYPKRPALFPVLYYTSVACFTLHAPQCCLHKSKMSRDAAGPSKMAYDPDQDLEDKRRIRKTYRELHDGARLMTYFIIQYLKAVSLDLSQRQCKRLHYPRAC